jgi:DNA-binding NtrC family response regulator
VRELENVIDRALILADGGHISLADLPPQITKTAPPRLSNDMQQAGSLRDQVRRFEAAIILRTIEETGGDRRAAALKLDIGLSSLYRKLEEFEQQSLLPDSLHTRHEAR